MSVFCHNMNTSAPREYLSLPTGERENYSEVSHQYFYRKILKIKCMLFLGVWNEAVVS